MLLFNRAYTGAERLQLLPHCRSLTCARRQHILRQHGLRPRNSLQVHVLLYVSHRCPQQLPPDNAVHTGFRCPEQLPITCRKHRAHSLLRPDSKAASCLPPNSAFDAATTQEPCALRVLCMVRLCWGGWGSCAPLSRAQCCICHWLYSPSKGPSVGAVTECAASCRPFSSDTSLSSCCFC